MKGSITKSVSIAMLASILLVAATLVGAASAGSGGITDPQVLELVTKGCGTNDGDPETECRVYQLRDSGGERSGQILRFRVPLRDIDGNVVGRGFLDCTAAVKNGSICTLVLSLKPGPYTELGTIVSTGTTLPPSAITGGSGAYMNVRGQITGEEQPDGFHLVVNLIP